MGKIIKLLTGIIFLGLLIYVLLPNPSFPDPLPDALQSKEPGDSEMLSVRRAYFTNATREEVMKHYQNQFKGYRLNYPPEEAKTIIRDQTRSTFLEEIVHPLRESIYINGFEPKDPKDSINIAGKPWRQKITVKYYPSSVFIRAIVVILSGCVTYLLLTSFLKKESK